MQVGIGKKRASSSAIPIHAIAQSVPATALSPVAISADVRPVQPSQPCSAQPAAGSMVNGPKTDSTVASPDFGYAAAARTEADANTKTGFEIEAHEDADRNTTDVELEHFYDASDTILAGLTGNGNGFKMFSKYYMACTYYILSMLCLLLPAWVQIKNWGHKVFLLGQYSFLRAVAYWERCNALELNMNTIMAQFCINWGCSTALWASLTLVADNVDFYLSNTMTWFVSFGLQIQLALALISDFIVMPFDIGFFLIASCWPMLGISLIDLQCILNMLWDFEQCCWIAGMAAVTASLRSVNLVMTAAAVRYYISFTAGLSFASNVMYDSYSFPSKATKKLTFSVETVGAQIEQTLILVELFWPGFFAVAPVFVFLLTRFLCTFGCWEAWFWHTVVSMVPDTLVTLAAFLVARLECAFIWVVETMLSTIMCRLWLAVSLAAQFAAILICTLAVGDAVQVSFCVLHHCYLSCGLIYRLCALSTFCSYSM